MFSGSQIGASPGWSSADELRLLQLNQTILLRGMWASDEGRKQLTPIRMSWHEQAARQQDSQMSSKAEIAAFFGGSVRTV